MNTTSNGQYSNAYLLSDIKCRIARPHNQWRPDGAPHCDYLELSLPAPPIDKDKGVRDLALYEWYANRSSINGAIVIEVPSVDKNASSITKSVSFKKGICYSIGEEYHIDQNELRTLKLKVFAEELTLDTVVI